MNEHSIEELERQLKAAISRREEAFREVTAAQKRLQDARNAASGIIGHVLEYTEGQGWGAKRKVLTRRLYVQSVHPAFDGGLEARGTLLVAGGKIGQRGGRVSVAKATDTGPLAA
jgi:hypothetical protein